MERILTFGSIDIQVRLEPHIVRIVNDAALWQLVAAGDIRLVDALAEEIGGIYRETYREELRIAHDSLVVEIWGHVYCEYFALVLERLLQLKLIDRLADKVIGYCEMIDCGESGYDHNRWFWDMLAPFRSLIARLLPDAIHTKGLKPR